MLLRLIERQAGSSTKALAGINTLLILQKNGFVMLGFSCYVRCTLRLVLSALIINVFIYIRTFPSSYCENVSDAADYRLLAHSHNGMRLIY